MIGKNPLGFGSGAPRFPKTKQENTPGPGAYSPKAPLPPTSTKGTWSKASRKLTAHQKIQLLQKNPLDSMHKKLKSGYKFQKTQLKDGRNVFILGGLARDVKTFQKLCKTYASSHKDDCIQIQKNLLKDVNDELHLLICNADLETDEFASKEVALIQELHGILTLTNQILGDSDPLMTKNNELIDQLTGRYTEHSNVVSVHFSDEPEHITRMANALIEKRTSLQDKTFVIKDATGKQEKNLREFTSDIHAKVKGGAFSKEERHLIPSLTGPKHPIKSAAMSKINIKLSNCLTKLGLPGAIAVIKDGQIIGNAYSNGFDANTQFQLGSVTKQFTAMGILKLVDSAKIALDTPLQSIEGLTDFPHGDQVTIRHLLNMTSGYPIHFECDETQEMQLNDLIAGIKALCEKNELEFSPGSKFSYSNINYQLLTYIIEKTSGKSYGDYMKHTVFEPLNMHRTGADFLDDNVANGKTIKSGYFVNSLQEHKSIPLGAGCLKSTINDMLKWQQCLDGLCQQTSEFISPKLARQMFAAPEGIDSTYGFGLHHVNQRMQSYEHSGRIMGGSTFFSSKQESSVIVLSNQDQFPASLLEQQARLICFQTKLDDPIEYSLQRIFLLLKQHNVTDSVSLIKETLSKNNFKNADRPRFVDLVGEQYFKTINENPSLFDTRNCTDILQYLQDITTTVIPDQKLNLNKVLLGLKSKLLHSSGPIHLDQYKKIGSGGTQDVYQINDLFVLKVHREKQPLTKEEQTRKLSQNQAAYETLAQHFGAHFIPETLFIAPINDSSDNKDAMVAVSSFEPGFQQPEKIALQSEAFQWNDIQIAETEEQLGIYHQMNESMLGITDPLPKETLDTILQGNDLVCKINDDPDLKSAVSKFLTTFETYYQETGQLIDIMGPDNVMFLKDQGQWTFKIGSVIKKESQEAIAEALTQSDNRDQLKLLRTSLTFIVALNTLGQYCLGRNIIQGDNVDRMAQLYQQDVTGLTREPKDVGMVRAIMNRLDDNDLDVINEYSHKADIFLSYIQSDRQRGEHLTRMIQTMHDTVPKTPKYGEFRFGLASKLIDKKLMPELAIELLTEVKKDVNAPQTRIDKMIQDLSKQT